jgi:hypothetical protein
MTGTAISRVAPLEAAVNKTLMYYVDGIPGSGATRRRAMTVDDAAEFVVEHLSDDSFNALASALQVHPETEGDNRAFLCSHLLARHVEGLGDRFNSADKARKEFREIGWSAVAANRAA